jgi:hypothetical protein
MLFKKLLQIIVLVITIAFIISCKKENTNKGSDEIDFSYEIQDTLIFEKISRRQLKVKVFCDTDTTFLAKIKNQHRFFKVNDILIPSNDSNFFQISLLQTDRLDTGIYASDFSITLPDENFTPKTKKLFLVYRPNCAYNYIKHQYGEITYQTVGYPVYREIYCGYSETGQLRIKNLTSYEFSLAFNCTDNTVKIQNFVHLGASITGNGQVINNEIHFEIFKNNVLDAKAIIKPF